MPSHATLTQSLFNKHASEYDQTRRQLIPPYDAFYGTVLQLLRNHVSGTIHVMDMGAGTGLLSEMVLAAFPDARITMVDLSHDMLQRSQERLKNDKKSIFLRVSDYTSDDLGGPFDAIVSGLSIHHIEGRGKLTLFRQVCQALKPGGIFINADQVLGEEPDIEKKYRENWLNRVLAAGITEEALAAARERMLADRMSPLSDQLTWLREAGFIQVNCWFKEYSFVVCAGIKPV